MLKILSIISVFVVLGCMTLHKKEKSPSPNPPNIEDGISLLGDSVVSCDNAIMAGYAVSNFQKPTRTFFCGKVKVPMGDGSDKVVSLTYIYFPPANFLKNKKSALEPVVFADLDTETTAIASFIKQASNWNGIIDQFGVLVVETRGGRFADPFIHCDLDDGSLASYIESTKHCIAYWQARFPITTLHINQVTEDLLKVADTIGISKFYFLSQSNASDFIAENLSGLAASRLKAVSFYNDSKRLATPDYDYKGIFAAIRNLDKRCVEDAFCKNAVGPLGTKFSKVLEANKEVSDDILSYIEDRLSKHSEVEDLYVRLHDFTGGENWEAQLKSSKLSSEDEESHLFQPFACDIFASQASLDKGLLLRPDLESKKEVCAPWQRPLSSPPPILHNVDVPVLVATGSLTPRIAPPKDRLSPGFRSVKTYEFDGLSTLNHGKESCQEGVFASFFQSPDLPLPPCRHVMQFEPLLSAKKLSIPDQDGWSLGKKDGDTIMVHKSDRTFIATDVQIRALFWQLYKMSPKTLTVKADPGLFHEKIWSTHLSSGKNVAIAALGGRDNNTILVSIETPQPDAVLQLSKAVHTYQRELAVYSYLPPFNLPGSEESEEEERVIEDHKDHTHGEDIYAQLQKETTPWNAFVSSLIPNFSAKSSDIMQFEGPDGRQLVAYAMTMTSGHEEEKFRHLRQHFYSEGMQEPVQSKKVEGVNWQGDKFEAQVFFSPVHGNQKGFLYGVSKDKLTFIYFSPEDELDFFLKEIFSRLIF